MILNTVLIMIFIWQLALWFVEWLDDRRQRKMRDAVVDKIIEEQERKVNVP